MICGQSISLAGVLVTALINPHQPTTDLTLTKHRTPAPCADKKQYSTVPRSDYLRLILLSVYRIARVAYGTLYEESRSMRLSQETYECVC